MRLTLSPPRKRAAIVLAIVLTIAVTAALALAPDYTSPAQPIPFSHRVHVYTKGLNCFFCHQSAAVSSNAGIPPVTKCLLCHNVIASKFAPISLISQYAQADKPIPWVRVNKVPEFVRFSHQPHIAKRVDCSYCHGNVRRMDRVMQPNHAFSMNFCVTCHWKRGAPADCTTCHY